MVDARDESRKYKVPIALQQDESCTTRGESNLRFRILIRRSINPLNILFILRACLYVPSSTAVKFTGSLKIQAFIFLLHGSFSRRRSLNQPKFKFAPCHWIRGLFPKRCFALRRIHRSASAFRSSGKRSGFSDSSRGR